MLLEAFPIMCKLALDKDLLLLGLQRRMIGLSIKVAASKIARDGEKAPSDFTKNQSACNIFGVLRAYLATFEQLLTTSFADMDSKLTDQYLGLQSILESTLDLLLLVRDGGKKNEQHSNDLISFHDNASFMNEDSTFAVLPDSACQSIFDIPTVRRLIGKQSECLWIGKFVFFCLRKAILCIDHCILSQACRLLL